MTAEDRLSHIQQTLDGISPGWPILQAHIEQEIAAHTRALIRENNEQTRGAIQALEKLIALPEVLVQEREAIQTALAQQAAE